jgi:peptide/nickel transport system ATP-binding protein
MKKEAIAIKQLRVSVDAEGGLVDLIREATLSLYPNETLALVGESGSGKTTFAEALLGLYSEKKNYHVSGEVIFNGKNLLSLPLKSLRELRGAKLSIIFQNPSLALNPVFSIGAQIAEVFQIHTQMSPEEVYKKTIELLDEVGLGEIQEPFEVYPHELSGGMKQRVMIAMAIAMGPEIILADEPTSALDLSVQNEILQLLKRYREAHSMAFLFITHDLSVVQEMADRVAVMYLGDIVELATRDELFSNPLHPYTKALFSALLTPDKRKQLLSVVSGVVPAPGDRPAGCPFHTRCPFVMTKCKQGKVEDFAVSATHTVRCWLYEEKR